jgi:nucleoside-diphosphate kinase
MRAVKLMKMGKELAARHYGEHEGKHFYEPLVRFMTSAPILAMVWEGPEAIAVTRLLAGATNAAEAQPGTIRGDLALSNRFNLVHASDGPESAAREIDLFFGGEELLSYDNLSDLIFNY